MRLNAAYLMDEEPDHFEGYPPFPQFRQNQEGLSQHTQLNTWGRHGWAKFQWCIIIFLANFVSWEILSSPNIDIDAKQLEIWKDEYHRTATHEILVDRCPWTMAQLHS